ncbi:OmpA family protein [Paeniroseomonas aquatica]|uniref:OmpA family protein n=1 Tax=Paeniroseomonas aquatica TaxID=373043 RepID=UPI003621D850
MEALPEGGFRLRFADGTAALPAEAAGSLAGLGSQLAAGPAGRVVVTGQASGPVADISIARRLSLARGLAVKQALAAGGLAPTRIDLRPMGRTADAADAVDVLPRRRNPPVRPA